MSREALCLLFIARRADNSSLHVRVSVIKLTKVLRRSEKSVRRYIGTWKERGVLDVLVRGGNGQPTKYAINLKNLAEWADHRSLRHDRRCDTEITRDSQASGQNQPYQRSHRDDQRCDTKMTGDSQVSGQNKPYQRSQRDDRQSDNRSFRSNASPDDMHGKSCSSGDAYRDFIKLGDALRGCEKQLGANEEKLS